MKKLWKKFFFEFIEKVIELDKDDKINYNTRLKNINELKK